MQHSSDQTWHGCRRRSRSLPCGANEKSSSFSHGECVCLEMLHVLLVGGKVCTVSCIRSAGQSYVTHIPFSIGPGVSETGRHSDFLAIEGVGSVDKASFERKSLFWTGMGKRSAHACWPIGKTGSPSPSVTNRGKSIPGMKRIRPRLMVGTARARSLAVQR